MIGHPVCTFMCRNRSRLNKKESVLIDTSLFDALFNANIDKICIENPVPSLAAGLPKYTQIIQPYHHGHDHSKKTCLWLKNLPKLKSTKNVYKKMMKLPKKLRNRIHYMSNTKNRGKDRSETYTGIAKAMANQWGLN